MGELNYAPGVCALCGYSPPSGKVADDPLPAALDESVRRELGTQFKIERLLGRGGMSLVYLAREVELNRLVAVKGLPIQLSMGPDAVERFKREARTSASISHPHIIPIYAVRETQNLLFFVMKYVEGRSLDTVIREQGKLPIPMVQAIMAQVGGALRASIEGVVPGVYREAGDERDIRVRLVESARDRTDELAALQVHTPRGTVPIAMLGALEPRAGATTIQRDDKQRTVQVNAYLAGGSLTEAARRTRLALDSLGMPPGYSYEIAGEFEMYQESFQEMAKALLLAVVLTYVLLAMLLESYVHPVTIMMTVPLGGIGVAFALFLTRTSVNIFSMMAVVMLVGIVVNNAILILDYAQQLRAQGKTAVEALLEATPTRLRPIIMTNVAIAIALLPQALGSGPGSFYRIPMAVVTMGGVLVSAVFTLVLIPVLYVKIDRIGSAVRRRVERIETGEYPLAE